MAEEKIDRRLWDGLGEKCEKCKVHNARKVYICEGCDFEEEECICEADKEEEQ